MNKTNGMGSSRSRVKRSPQGLIYFLHTADEISLVVLPGEMTFGSQALMVWD
ncbi:MAG: hypothetical protein R8N23_07100 [Reichenbachiella sp.]|uniref:hypothetical protein n=1 Tax=Reichenbachiella sp. TaxID=2184521 RepID=UPI0029660234|nr:hypothetical protein [Reichenbachiella sp.]MDW3209614.1 hypothetical protein [Reichenbachiella sp.]